MSRFAAASLSLVCAWSLCGDMLRAEPLDDRLAPWRRDVVVRPVSEVPGRHTIHSYYVSNPESPDGRYVLFYASRADDGQFGDVCLLERASGRETVLAANVRTEDAHRAACQQWLAGGKLVAFHEVVDGRWRVVTVDIATGDKRVVAEDHQLGFGAPLGNVLPLYGCHWKPGEYRDLELLDVATGQRRTTATSADVRAKYGAWVAKEFAGKEISIFFPVLSPDGNCAFLKIAAGSGGDNFMSKAASHRQGLLAYDFRRGDFTMMRTKWGHPAWLADSRRIIEVGHFLIDADGGAAERLTNLPHLSGSHPSTNPAMTLFVTDGLVDKLGKDQGGGDVGEWGVMVGDLRGGQFVVLHKFRNDQGAKSWRRNHPHPAFSADGKRIYFNVSAGKHTQLFVAEAR